MPSPFESKKNAPTLNGAVSLLLLALALVLAREAAAALRRPVPDPASG